METSQNIPSIMPNSNSETPTLVHQQVNNNNSLEKTTTVYITKNQKTGELLFDKTPDSTRKDSPPYSPAGDDTLWNKLFPEPPLKAQSFNEIQEIYNQIFPTPSQIHSEDIIAPPLSQPSTTKEFPITLEELRERYKLVHKYTSLLDSPDSSNALHLSGVSTDPNNILTTVPSPLESMSPREDYSMIEITRETIEEKGWDSIEDHITID